MSRRRGSYKREIIPDPVYKDVLVSKFVNLMMFHGKKSAAQNTLYGALDEIKVKMPNEDALSIMKKAIENVKPSVEVRSRRVGGANYQVPVDVRPVRRTALALRWLVEFARERGESSMDLRLAGELMDAYQNRGNAIKKREDVHKMADANRAFAHYRW